MPCFLSDHIKPPGAEDRSRNRLMGSPHADQALAAAVAPTERASCLKNLGMAKLRLSLALSGEDLEGGTGDAPRKVANDGLQVVLVLPQWIWAPH